MEIQTFGKDGFSQSLVITNGKIIASSDSEAP